MQKPTWNLDERAQVAGGKSSEEHDVLNLRDMTRMLAAVVATL